MQINSFLTLALGTLLCTTPNQTLTAQSHAPASTPKKATIFLNESEIGDFRSRKDSYRALIKRETARLDYQPMPVAVFEPEPHYNANGVSSTANNGKQFATDAQAAYRAGLCYLLTNDERFAATAQRILDAWAGTLKEVTTPQGKSSINFNMPYMTAAASWVRGAGNWNSTPFDQFLSTTIMPLSETKMTNNHGFWAVLTEAGGAAYLGDTKRLSEARTHWLALIRGAVTADGSMPQEVERSATSNWRGGPDKGIKGLAYTHYALLPASLGAKIFADAGQPIWNTPEGKQLQTAFDRAAAWTLHPETFPYYASNGGRLHEVRNASYFPLLLRYYPNPDAEAVLKQGDVGMNGFLLLDLFGQR